MGFVFHFENLSVSGNYAWLKIQIFGMKSKAPGAQQPECTSVHEDCEHRATRQFAQKMDLQPCIKR